MGAIITGFLAIVTLVTGGIFLTSDSVETKQAKCMSAGIGGLNPNSPDTIRQIEVQCKDIYK